MQEFNIGKLIRFLIIAFICMSVLRACTVSTMGGYGRGGYYGAGHGGGGFFTGMLLGNMMGGGSVFGGGSSNRTTSVRQGSYGSRARGGGFGFGK